jgi:hypothetical protein
MTSTQTTKATPIKSNNALSHMIELPDVVIYATSGGGVVQRASSITPTLLIIYTNRAHFAEKSCNTPTEVGVSYPSLSLDLVATNGCNRRLRYTTKGG